MIDERRTEQKLEELAAVFKSHALAKRYPQAKRCYDTARNIAVFMELAEEKREELFGIRGERGIIEKEGMFPEYLVQKVYLETCVKAREMPENCLLCEGKLQKKNGV